MPEGFCFSYLPTAEGGSQPHSTVTSDVGSSTSKPGNTTCFLWRLFLRTVRNERCFPRLRLYFVVEPEYNTSFFFFNLFLNICHFRTHTRYRTFVFNVFKYSHILKYRCCCINVGLDKCFTVELMHGLKLRDKCHPMLRILLKIICQTTRVLQLLVSASACCCWTCVDVCGPTLFAAD